jgi:hypothetical protein
MKSLLTRWIKSHLPGSRKSPIDNRHRLPRLGLEALEDRLVLSTFTVTSLADVNPPTGVMTLRQAILTANADGNADPNHPDVINFSVAGSILLNAQLPSLTGSVSIEGPGQSSLTVLGDGLGDRLLTVAPGAAASVSDLTLDGNQLHNAGIAVGAAATLSIQDATIQNANAKTVTVQTMLIPGNGGGVDNEGGTVRVDHARFVNDAADNLGGGIANVGGTLTISASTFTLGLAIAGGGIYDSCNVAGGGGLLTVAGSVFSNNVSGGAGGGVDLNSGASATIVDSTFVGNNAVSGGGGIDVSRQGGGIPDLPITLSLSGSTLTGNAAEEGGGLFILVLGMHAPATATLRNTIVAGNSNNNTSDDIRGALDPTSAFNLIGDGSALSGISAGVNGNQVGTHAAPIDPKLGSLQDNGGPTFTMALLPGSPALDAGSGEATTDTDQRGVPRSHVTDIGAYQATASRIVVSTSSPATVGVSQAVMIQAFDSFGQAAYDDQDALSFTSSDRHAVLPATSSLMAGLDSFFATFGTVGTQSLTATDTRSGLAGSQNNILVQPAATTTLISSSANPSVYGQAVTFTATVTSNVAGEGNPVGSVTFFNGTKQLGTVTLKNGSATFTDTGLAAGSYNISAVFTSASMFSGDTSNVLSQTITKATSVNQLTVTPGAATVGQAVTLTATLSDLPGQGATPQGTVTFRDGSAVLGTARLNAAGVAIFQTSALGIGDHKLTSIWFGDNNTTGSTSPTVLETINPVSTRTTTTIVSNSPNPSVYGQTVTFSVLVSGPGGTPTGIVSFLDGTKTLGTATLSTGMASLTVASLAAGSHGITAVYGGDSAFTGSTSAVLSQTVNKAISATILTVSPPTITAGQTVTLTAVVAIVPPGDGMPQGTVTFRDGSITLGTARLNATGVAVLQISSFGAGSHNLTAIWFGDSNNVGSTSPAVTETVNPMIAPTVPPSADLPQFGIGDPALLDFLVTLADLSSGGRALGSNESAR